MQMLSELAGYVGQFFNWLGIHPSLQDLAKAVILTLFVLAILMIVGDVYRGEIQNKLHRIRLVRHPGNALPQGKRDVALQVPQAVVELPLNNVFSNALLYLRYRDHRGRLRTKRIIDYRVRLKVRLAAFAQNVATNRLTDHDYTDEENERLANETSPAIVSMAGSRVDYIYEGIVEKFQERVNATYQRLKRSRFSRAVNGVREHQLVEPEFVGLCMKFHFPINPYFLLYKHPDTNVRTTAWLTVLTSVFALFMQLVYGDGGTNQAQAAPQVGPAAVVQQTSLETDRH